MAIDDLLIAAKERAQESTELWLRCQSRRANLQALSKSEKRVHKQPDGIQVAFVVDIKPPYEEILEYSDKFVLDLLGYANTGTLMTTKKVKLNISQSSGDKLIPTYFVEYNVRSTDTKSIGLSTSKKVYHLERGGLVFPVIRKYGNPLVNTAPVPLPTTAPKYRV